MRSGAPLPNLSIPQRGIIANGVAAPRSGSSTGDERRGEDLTIVFAADEAFAQPLAVALYSALVHLPAQARPTLYVLSTSLSADTRRRLTHLIGRTHPGTSVRWIAPDLSLLRGLKLDMLARLTDATLYRLLIPEVIEAGRALYLDCDLIVEGDLTPLWNTDLAGRPMAAVQERTVSCPRFGLGGWKELGLAPETPYSNSGVMLMDLDLWRAEGLHRSVIRYLQNPGHALRFPSDQEGLNAVLAGRWQPLDPRWNAVHNFYFPTCWPEIAHQVDVADPATVQAEARIVHFTSHRKPWLPAGYAHPQRPRFWHYLRRSEWLSPARYAARRLDLMVRGHIYNVRESSRPVRHRLGMRRPFRNGPST